MDKKVQTTYPRPKKEILRIMRAADKNGQLLPVILEEFVQHTFSMPALWESREYFRKLGNEECVRYPVLFSHLALLSAMTGRLDEARAYVDAMEMALKYQASENTIYHEVCRCATEIVMPYTTDIRFLKDVFWLIEHGQVPVANLTLSASRPGILNGFRDFTRFGRYLEKYKDVITDTIEKLYGNAGKSVYEIMLAEWNYQKNDCFRALVLVTGTIPLIEQEQDMRCLFVALALQMKILIVNGQTKAAGPLVIKIRDRIHKTGWEELNTSLDALECLAACYDGRQEEVTAWLEHVAPDENHELYMMDVYAYLVKIRCYIQTGKYMVAHVLVQQLTVLLQQGNRPMDLCECYMLSAVICYKVNDEDRMFTELSKALEIAKKRQYIRLLADEGSCMAQMIFAYQKKYGTDEFTDKIMQFAAEVGRHFPDYLKSPIEYYEPLTKTEEAVLRLMGQGMSNSEIADMLGKKTGTVKFHSNNIFKKFDVTNRQQAVNLGREIGLL